MELVPGISGGREHRQRAQACLHGMVSPSLSPGEVKSLLLHFSGLGIGQGNVELSPSRLGTDKEFLLARY